MKDAELDNLEEWIPLLAKGAVKKVILKRRSRGQDFTFDFFLI